MPLGVLAAQLIHAAGESASLWTTKRAMRLAEKMDPNAQDSILAGLELQDNTFAVCLASNDELQLLELEHRLVSEGIPHKAIREPDPPWNGSLMSIGIVPAERSKLKRILSKYSLLKEIK